MILILDACTIANILNVYQDAFFINVLKKHFDKVYVPLKVYEELCSHMKDYIQYYSNFQELRQLYSECETERLIYHDGHSKECRSFINKFSASKKLPFKERTGEFHSCALSLELSRFSEGKNSPRIIFATDDAKAETFYKELFRCNQIGLIIDSIDLISILHIRKTVSRAELLDYVQGIFGVYNLKLNALIKHFEELRLQRPENTQYQSYISKLLSLLREGEFNKVEELFNSRFHRKFFTGKTETNSLINKFLSARNTSKNQYFRKRFRDIKDELLWTA